MMLNSFHSNVQMVCSKDSKWCFLNPRICSCPWNRGKVWAPRWWWWGSIDQRSFKWFAANDFKLCFLNPWNMLAHEKVIMMWFNSSKISHKDQNITEITSHRNHWNHSNGHNMDLQAPCCQMQLQITWSSNHVAGDGAPCLQLWTELLASIRWHNTERRMHSCERARIPDAIAND